MKPLGDLRPISGKWAESMMVAKRAFEEEIRMVVNELVEFIWRVNGVMHREFTIEEATIAED